MTLSSHPIYILSNRFAIEFLIVLIDIGGNLLKTAVAQKLVSHVGKNVGTHG